MGLSYKKGILLAEIEATPGTAETLVVGDGGLVITDITPSWDPALLKRNAITQDFGQLASVSGSFAGGISFETELKGSGAAGVPSLIDDLLRMVGFGAGVVVADTSVTYDLVSTGIKTGTLAFDLQESDGSDGPRFMIYGAVGNLVISGNVNEFMRLRFEMRGILAPAADVSPLSPTFETVIPPVLRSGTFTIGGTALKGRGFEINLGNQIALNPDINASRGFAYAEITDREPTGTLQMEYTKVATHNFQGLLEANTEAAMVIKTPVAAGNTVQLSASKLQYTGLSINNVAGKPVASVPIQLNKGGTNELEIQLT
ncbi:MAG: hypothetical protein AB7T38_02445 [Nitrospirales bacterium]